MPYLERGGTKMNSQTLNATIFGYSASYFNAEFEGILGKIIICYNLMIANKVVLPNNENRIRNELTFNYLNRNEVRREIGISKYLFEPESPTKDNLGRTDIKIISDKTFEDTNAYYIIECKRLDDENINGTTGLNAKYIDEGIARFTNEQKYPFYSDTAGMIGFIVSKMNIRENVDCINKLLQNAFNQIDTVKGLTKKQITPDFEYSYYSNHKVEKSTRIIYHLMFDFSNSIAIDS